MRVLLFFNPFAGSGRAGAAATSLADRLESCGHSCIRVETQAGRDGAWLDRAWERSSDLAVVVGGDGAVRLVAPAAARCGVPLWQCPLGTENLFAREWGMTRGSDALLEAIDRMAVGESDLAQAAGECFTLMSSVGLDAEVVHDLASRRRGGISHLSYVPPILRSLGRPWPRRLRVDVDGRRLDDGSTGFLVVANSRQYAMRLDPLPGADATDGLLDVGWFPARGLSHMVGWSLRCLLRRQHLDPRMRAARARRVVIECEEPFRYQLDGDAPATIEVAAAVRRLEIEVLPSRLRVLLGADRATGPDGAPRDGSLRLDSP